MSTGSRRPAHTAQAHTRTGVWRCQTAPSTQKARVCASSCWGPGPRRPAGAAGLGWERLPRTEQAAALGPTPTGHPGASPHRGHSWRPHRLANQLPTGQHCPRAPCKLASPPRTPLQGQGPQSPAQPARAPGPSACPSGPQEAGKAWAGKDGHWAPAVEVDSHLPRNPACCL